MINLLIQKCLADNVDPAVVSSTQIFAGQMQTQFLGAIQSVLPLIGTIFGIFFIIVLIFYILNKFSNKHE